MSQFVWACPSCGRAVPNRLNACRCGCARPDVAAQAPPTAPPAAPPSAPSDRPPQAAGSPPQAAGSSTQASKRALLIAGVALAALAGAWVAATSLFGTADSPADDRAAAAATSRPRNAAMADARASRGGRTPDAPADGPERPSDLPDAAPTEMPAADEPLALLSTEELVTRSLPAVVTVETRGGSGSGFYVSRDTLLTNWHGVTSATAVTLRASNGQTSVATVLTSSPDLDLAVLKAQIVNHDQAVLPLAEPQDVRIGAEVVAIGSPLGLRNTVTRGIVSGVRNARGVNLVQTDAAINPGNSGGPLIDRYGRVIGVNTAKLVGETEAIGFAVSVQHTRTLLGPEFTAPSVMQRKRDNSLKRYEDSILLLARGADGVEENWRKFKPECYIGVAEVVAVREWFALADGPPPGIKPLARCRSWMPYFQDWSERTKAALRTYEDTALQAGVPAARLRAVRQRYNMTWAGWQQ